MEEAESVLIVNNWTDLVVLLPYGTWTEILKAVWERFNAYSPRYYEVRRVCTKETAEIERIAVSFRFFRMPSERVLLETELREFMNSLGLEDWSYIDPKLHKDEDEKARYFAGLSGFYDVGIQRDELHTSDFIKVLQSICDIAVNLVASLDSMTCSHPEAQNPRCELAHLFANMMCIRDCLMVDLLGTESCIYMSKKKIKDILKRYPDDE